MKKIILMIIVFASFRSSGQTIPEKLDKLKSKPHLLLVDGNRFKAYNDFPHKCIIKGDGMPVS